VNQPKTRSPSKVAPLDPHTRDLPAGVVERTLLGAVLDPTVAIDDLGTIVLASASVEPVFGWRPEELLGRNVRVLMGDPHSGRHDEYLAEYRRTGVTHILGRTREFEVVRKDGGRLVCELSIARAEMPEGTPTLFIGSFRDVTARRAAERALESSERRFRAIFESSYQFMGLLRTDGTLLEANRTALDFVGAAREEVVGKPFWDTPWWRDSGADQERVRAAIAEAARGEFVRFETAHRDRNGDVHSIDFSLKPVFDDDGAVTFLIPEGRNVTELKRAQRAEIAMQRALATIGESAAVLAHEIKNPITAINVALRVVAKQLGEDERSVLEDLARRMQRLEALMRRTLSFAKPLELRIARVDARELLESAVAGLRDEIQRYGAEVRVDSAARLDFPGDRQLLDEVLTNLVRNALEAAPKPARVELAARRASDGDIVLTVDDDGPGIPDSLRATLFKPFTTTKHDGTGLGLAFCRKVVQEHGGDIEPRRSALGGARFEIRLPPS
jgi:PAS domain S-box-containing protein